MDNVSLTLWDVQDYGEPFLGDLAISVQPEGDNYDLVVSISIKLHFDFEKKMRHVFVTIITITNTILKLEGCWTLQATSLLLQLPKRLAFVSKIFFNQTILLFTLTGT